MSKTVVINFGSGSLNQGFPKITVRLWTQYSQAGQFVGSLPAAPELVKSYRVRQVDCQTLYSCLVLHLSLVEDQHFTFRKVVRFISAHLLMCLTEVHQLSH